ncbi:DMT family transporter [Massilia endophytica]|uniref:DMT family transporter n=1 Tax=Massilia endophytica TaxID=2899220 RepID=UPI001E3FC3A0|nr:DMT family transporter [Massilia endophytica]UGQ44679.1 DMT family transporter [Massilia endophytica]
MQKSLSLALSSRRGLLSHLSAESAGMLLGLIGVAIFSLTLPFTRMAVAELDPVFSSMARAVIAAALSGGWLLWSRAPLPSRAMFVPLFWVAAGCVIGFPLLTSMAMQHVPASHGAVLIGILPLMTALFSALRNKEKPSRGFWAFALLGSAIVVGFALRENSGVLHPADLAILAAGIMASFGYAEGARASHTLGGTQTICWALLLALPVTVPLTLVQGLAHADGIAEAGARAWTGLAYTSVFSMFLGFFFWYRGMVLGGVARVGQVQLVQPFLTLLGAALVLGEPLQGQHLLFALAVIATVGFGRRMAIRR